METRKVYLLKFGEYYLVSAKPREDEGISLHLTEDKSKALFFNEFGAEANANILGCEIIEDGIEIEE